MTGSGIGARKTGHPNSNTRKGCVAAMIEQDTVKLLRECDAGVKMGVASIDDVLGYVHSTTLK